MARRSPDARILPAPCATRPTRSCQMGCCSLPPEEKWVLALRGGGLAARSLTGSVAVIARLQRNGGEVHVHGLQIAKTSGLEVLGDPVQMFDWLVRSHALKQVVPLPVSDDGAGWLEVQPHVAFSLFG